MKISFIISLFAAGLFSGCIAGTFEPEKTAAVDRLPVQAEVVPTQQTTVTADAPMRHTQYCAPKAESNRPGAPSVEVGVAKPVGDDAETTKATLYSRYDCH